VFVGNQTQGKLCQPSNFQLGCIYFAFIRVSPAISPSSFSLAVLCVFGVRISSRVKGFDPINKSFFFFFLKRLLEPFNWSSALGGIGDWHLTSSGEKEFSDPNPTRLGQPIRAGEILGRSKTAPQSNFDFNVVYPRIGRDLRSTAVSAGAVC